MEQTDVAEKSTPTTGKKAIVIGGTGAIGKVLFSMILSDRKHLVQELIASDNWSKVTALVRKKADFPEHGIVSL